MKILTIISFFLILFSSYLPLSAQDIPANLKELVFGVKNEQIIDCQELHSYAFELKRGQVVRFKITEKGADVLAIVSRTGDIQKVSAIANVGTGFMQESLTVIADRDGVYLLEIRAEKVSDSVGKYEFTATLSNTATISDKQRFEAEKLLEEANAILINNDTEKFPTALENLEKVLKVRQNLTDVYGEAITKMLLGNYYFKLEDFTKAESYFTQSLALFDNITNKAEVGYVNTTLGTLYAFSRNELKARKYITDGIDILKTIGDKRSEQAFNMIKLRNLSEIFSSDGETINIPNLDKELNNAKKTNDEAAQLKAWTKAVWANALDEGGQEFNEFYNTLDLTDFESNKSKIENKRAELNEKSLLLVKRVEQQGLSLARKLKDKHSEAQILIALGFAYTNLESESSESEDEEDEENITAKKAKSYLIQGLAQSKILNDKILESYAYAGLSGFYMDFDEQKLSVYFAKNSINSIHNLRQNLKNFADKETQQLVSRITQPLYQQIAGLLIEEERYSEAVQILNLGRDQEFFDFKLIDCQPPAQLSLTVNEKKGDEKFQGVLNQIVSKNRINPNLTNEAVSAEVSGKLTELENTFDDEKDSENDKLSSLADVSEMQEALRVLSKSTGKKHVTIYYFEDDGSQILLITPETIKSFSGSGPETSINTNTDVAMIQSNNRGVNSPGRKLVSTASDIYDDFINVLKTPRYDPRPLGSKIYQQLFKTIDDEDNSNTLEKELEEYKTDVIHWSLSGNIRSIPITALYDENSGQYLLEKYENVVFTRASKARFLTDQKPWTIGLGFGTTRPIKGIPNSALPAADDELFTIFGNPAASQPGLHQGKIFLDEEYTRDTFLSIPRFKPNFVHIAAHFSFQPGDASGSFLPLVDGSKISLAELQQAGKLFDGVDLLTLSACETASIKSDTAGKEVDGLAELAQRLGAKSVIATLWKIDDDGTSKLMSEYYRLKKAKPDLSNSEVLREAQIRLLNGKNTWEKGYALRRESSRGVTVKTSQTNQSTSKIEFNPTTNSEFEHPYYWAPFVMYGSSNSKGISQYIRSKPTPVITANPNYPSTSNNSVAGIWSGKYVCGQGVTGATLKLEQYGNNVQGTFEFYPLPENPTFRAGSGFYKGTIDPNFGVMQLNGDRWINQPDINWTLVGFSGSFDENRIKFTGKMLSSNCGAIELRRDNSSQFSDNSRIAGNSTLSSKVTLADIENSFKANLVDDVINKSRIFLMSEPENVQVNTYLGYGLMMKRNLDEALPYFEKVIEQGQAVIFPVKRLRVIVGNSYDEGQISISKEGVIYTSGNTIFRARLSDLKQVQLMNYKNQCNFAQLKGTFTETYTNSEKKKVHDKGLDFFPFSSALKQVQVWKTFVNEAYCNEEGIPVPTMIIKLLVNTINKNQ